MYDAIREDGGLAALRAAVATLAQLSEDVQDSVRVDRIRLLEELKSAAAAAQAAETAAFSASQRASQLAQGIPAERASRGVAAQIGLAKRQSPFHAARYVGWSKILTEELPATFAALRAGVITEWRAMIVARETAWHVSARPAPDTMIRLTGVLPVEQGVAAYAALKQHADSLVSQGDLRALGQIMADTLVERVTGQAHAADVSIEIQLLMTDESLLGSDDAQAPSTGPEPTSGVDEPAELIGYGPIPAAVARDIVSGAAAVASPPRSAVSSSPATRRAARPGATQRSGTSTTLLRPRTVARPPSATGRATAPHAITPGRPQGGSPIRDRVARVQK